jgi:hypothetical protein
MSRWLDRVSYFSKVERCVRCGKKDAYTMSGHQRCYECTEKCAEEAREYHEKNRESHVKAMQSRYYRLKSQGLCVQCGKEPAVGVRCKKCRAIFNQYQTKRLKGVIE